MKITVLGSGGWGTALSILLHDNGHQVTLWSFQAQEAETMRATHENPMLKGVALPEGITFVNDFSPVSDSDMVVFATPSFAVRQTARNAAPFLRPGTAVVSVTKGIEGKTGLRMSEIIREEIHNSCQVVALSGPSHAEEVGRKVPTGVVAACADLAAAELVQDTFMSPVFRVYTNPDIVGVELGGALKNVIALCCGVSDGMGLGDNTKALMMTRGMTEMARLGVALGGRSETFAGLSGMGDLIVTCTSMHSRNRRAGILIGKGESAQQAMEEVGAVVEGYYAAESAHMLAEKVGVDMPICRSAYEVLYEGRPVQHVLEDLMGRQKRGESDQSWI